MNAVPFFSGLRWHDLLFIAIGAWRTLELTLVSALFGTLLGFFVGWARTSPSRLVTYPLGGYIDVVRSVPLIVQFILFNSGAAIAGMPLDPFWSGVAVLSLYMAGYVAEVVKAGIASVPDLLSRAGRSLGLTYLQTLRHVVAPLGTRTVFPAWVGLVLGLMKDTSLVSVLGYIELLRASQIVINRAQQPLLILSGAGAFYFAMCYPMAQLSRRLERRWSDRRKTT